MKQVPVHILDGFFAGEIVTVRIGARERVIKLLKHRRYSPEELIEDSSGPSLHCSDDWQDYLVIKREGTQERYIGVCTRIMLNIN